MSMVAGLVLALVSAAAINLGFLLQHRGLRGPASTAEGDTPPLWTALRSPFWLGGQALGWAGFAAQIVAVSIAPLSLVQSFAAGGLALSVPIAARLFGAPISRRQRLAVLLAAAGLATLPLGLRAGSDHLQSGSLTVAVVVALAIAVAIGLTRRAPLLAIAAGLFYGVADGAIKAVSVSWGPHGAGALLSVWTALAVLGTFAGFVAFQAALRAGSAVSGISLMNCLAAVVALGCGLLAFGESLGGSGVATTAHIVALTLVFACIPVLASAHTEIADALEPPGLGATHPITRGDAPERSGDGASGGEYERLQPRPQAGRARPHHVTQR
jgi:hypothetical protein